MDVTSPRLTKSVVQQLLDNNNGFTSRTYFKDKNNTEERQYSVVDGALHIRATGKTSWADSRYDDTFLANDTQTRDFLKKNWQNLNTEGIR